MTTPLVIGKVVMAFTSAQTEHGGRGSTISRSTNTRRHRSVIALPSGTSLGYTVHEVFDGHENPNDTFLTSDHQPSRQIRPRSSSHGHRYSLARLARVIRAARQAGFLTAAATSEPFLQT
jgi:hypothetical protein